MAEPSPLVFMGLLGLDSHNQEEARLVTRLAQRGHRVLYLAPLGVGDPGPRRWLAGLRRLRRGSRPATATQDVHVRSIPLWVIPGRGLAPVAALNRRLVRWRIEHGLRQLRQWKQTQPVLWLRLPTPEIVDQLPRLRLRGVVYECIDDYSTYPHYGAGERRRLERCERQLAARADLLLTLSVSVASRFPHAAHKAQVVPLGVDLTLFGQPAGDPPADLALLPRPRLGLVGGLDQRVDFELLRRLALADPNWSLVLVGPAIDAAEVRRLAQLPNVHVLGRQPYDRMPAYMSGLDVCLIPYRSNAWTAGCFPAKLLEYLACGRPVVATNLPGLAAYAGVIDLASDVPSFVAACQRAAAERDPTAEAHRRDVASDASLDARCQVIDDLLASLPVRSG